MEQVLLNYPHGNVRNGTLDRRVTWCSSYVLVIGKEAEGSVTLHTQRMRSMRRSEASAVLREERSVRKHKLVIDYVHKQRTAR